MEILKTSFEGLIILQPSVYEDGRGYFFESYNQKNFDEQIGTIRFVQDNESQSKYGVLRGLHFQKTPMAQAKLVRVTRGEVLDVAVDLRPGSKTFGSWYSVQLSSANKKQLFIPRGFAHGFITLSQEATFCYKCDNFYSKDHEGGICYDDPKLNIDWMLPEDEIIVSEKDAKLPLFHQDHHKIKI